MGSGHGAFTMHGTRPRLLVPVRWDEVRTYCESAARRLARRMSGLE
jgi:hypothetical protein